jgi:hypothetical protein
MQEISAALREYAPENQINFSDPTAEEKEKFLKSVLSDSPYEELVELFDGQLNIKLKSMSVAENNDVIEQITLDKEKNIAENTDAYFITISTYRLALCLLTVDGKIFSDITKESFVKNDESSTYIRERAKIMQSWPTFKLSAFLSAFNTFENKVVALTNAVQQRNFWKASA